MSNLYFVHSLGCKVNSYETAAVGTILETGGFRPTDVLEKAGVIVLNTCSVTGKADQKSRQHISSFRKRNPNAILVVMGCYSQTHAEQAIQLGADIVLGAASRSAILTLIDRFSTERKPIVEISPSIRRETYEELGATAFCENARAYLKVQDGCDNFCSYCLIPFLRGNSRSRDPRAVIEEAMALTSSGYQEIIITGIHIGAYGKDLADGSFRLADLIEAILNKCPALARLRISSIEESEIDDHLLSLMAREPRIADHLHIPLQSGSQGVLQRMKRHYTTDDFLAKLAAIRTVRPDIAITTDVIAGFPDETEEEWEETKDFCRRAAFAEIHVFPYSSRPGTAASRLKDLDPTTKKNRVKELLNLSRELRDSYESRFFGRTLPVLFEDYDAEKRIAWGHTSNYLKVAFPSEEPLHGQWKEILYIPSIKSD